MRVATLQREDFLQNYLDVNPGEHFNVISPTGGGKSHLMYQCLNVMHSRYPDLTYASFQPKPGADETTEKWAAALKLKVTESWPPYRWPWQAKPPGHVLWPPHIPDDEAANREHLSGTFKNAINDLYWRGNSVTMVDNAYLAGVHYGLNPELDRHWIAGRSNHASLWTTLQKPSGTLRGAVSSFAYDSPIHLFRSGLSSVTCRCIAMAIPRSRTGRNSLRQLSRWCGAGLVQRQGNLWRYGSVPRASGFRIQRRNEQPGNSQRRTGNGHRHRCLY
jgi:hypothetical protein